MLLTVITATIRPAGAFRAAQSVQSAREHAPGVEVRHTIAYWPGAPDHERERIGAWLTELIRQAAPGWVFFLDDDNLMHPRFLEVFKETVLAHPDARAILFAMDYPAFSDGVLRPQLPPHVGYIDGGQVAIRQEYAATEDWRPGMNGDGLYLAALYARAPEAWVMVQDVVTSHNGQVR